MKIKAGTVLPEAAALASLFTPAEVFDDEPVVVQEARFENQAKVRHSGRKLRKRYDRPMSMSEEYRPDEVLGSRYMAPGENRVTYGTRVAVNSIMETIGNGLTLEDAFYLDSAVEAIIEALDERLVDYT